MPGSCPSTLGEYNERRTQEMTSNNINLLDNTMISEKSKVKSPQNTLFYITRLKQVKVAIGSTDLKVMIQNVCLLCPTFVPN